MDFDDLFENKKKHRENYKYYRHKKDDSKYSHRTNQWHSENEKWLNIWEKIRSNNKLKLLILLAAIITLCIIIGLIIILWPIALKLFNIISQNGLQGILDLIWKGSGI